MDQDLYQRAKALFQQICHLEPEQRSRALAEASSNDPELRAEVESLLAYQMAETDPDVAVAMPSDDAAPGGRIGPYRLLRELGRGGMGVVYLAVHEEDGFRRHVALKVLKLGMDTEEILKRFEVERRVHAALNHPGIARLYDAGKTHDGRPYFALEYIEKGVSLDDYCNRQRLSIAQRLELFVSVCDAVQYAHRNLVVHRDLKPDNIVVTPEGIPKLLDFGIAKILNPDLALIGGDPTGPNVRLMTPEYASPEQVRGDHISTASDVYTLGVILFELVTGCRPYRLRSRVRAEIERVILEEDPELPSTAISHIDEPPEEEIDPPAADPDHPTTRKPACSLREERPEHLRRRLAGDIDNIVLKAMRKEPARRYESVGALGEDIRRHLGHRPVMARGDSLIYRAHKFVERNRAGVAIAALLVLAATLSIVVAFATQAQRAADTRAAAERTARELSDDRAAGESARSRRLLAEFGGLANFYLDDLHEEIEKLRGSVLGRELIIERARSDLEILRREAGDEPDILLRLAYQNQLLGEIQGGVRNPSRGDTPAALASFATALDFTRAVLVQRPGDAEARRRQAMVLILMADLFRNSSAPGDWTTGLRDARRAVEIAESLYEERPADMDSARTFYITLDGLGKALKRNEQLEAARACYERSMRLREERALRVPESDTQMRRDLSVGYSRMGGVFQGLWTPGDRETTRAAEEALRWYAKAIDVRQTLHVANRDNNREARDLAVVHRLYGSLAARIGRTDEATTHLQRYIDLTEELSWASPNDDRAMRDLFAAHDVIGALLARGGDRERAMTSYRAYQPLLLRYARDAPSDRERWRRVAHNAEEIALQLAADGDREEAERSYDQAVDARRTVLAITDAAGESRRDADCVALARCLGGLGLLLVDVERPTEAEPLLAESVTMYEELLTESPNEDLSAELAEIRAALRSLRGSASPPG